MPEERFMGPLLEKASDLLLEAAKLGATTAAHSELSGLLRSMNSYYTNRIEGEHTRPIEIERALQQEFSDNRDIARKQRLAVAHIRTEEKWEAALDEQGVHDEAFRQLYSLEKVTWLHGELFAQLDQEDLQLADGTLLQPGVLRDRGVAIGKHEPPPATAVAQFIRRWAEKYGHERRGVLSMVAAAASHHRLAWIHPFADGNGRVTRLHTHLVLHAMGLTRGLWSPLRGFARTEDDYRRYLQEADEHRHSDYDGRGNLTTAGLVQWIEYCLRTWIDQVRFMSQQLDVSSISERIEAALVFDEKRKQRGIRSEALRPLHYLFATKAELGRADFKAMCGLGDRTATDLLSALLRCGYLASDTPYGKVRFAVPRHALRFYFPSLWPEAEQDLDMQIPVPSNASASAGPSV